MLLVLVVQMYVPFLLRALLELQAQKLAEMEKAHKEYVAILKGDIENTVKAELKLFHDEEMAEVQGELARWVGG